MVRSYTAPLSNCSTPATRHYLRAMATTAIYQEKWPNTEISANIFGAAAGNQAEAMAHIQKLQMEIMPGMMANSDAARRDWAKICKLETDLERNFAATEKANASVAEAATAQAATEEAAPFPEQQHDASTRVSQPERDADDAAQEEDAECGPASQAEASSIDAPPQPKASARKTRNEVEDDGGNASGERSVRQRNEWEGRTVVFSHAVAPRKMLKVPMKILKINGASAKLQYKQQGQTKEHVDSFPVGTDLSTRYTRVHEEAQMDLDRFLQDWSCHDVADPPPLAAPALPLTDVLPVGQMPTNIPESESAWRLLRLMGVDPRSAISAVLAAGIRPFKPAEVYRASCDGLVFETTSEHLRRVGHACDLKRAFLQELLGGVPRTGGRRVGHCELHPWQAAVAANIMETRSDNGSMLVELRQDVAQHSVKVELCVPQRAAVLHAATGTGKTYVACMLAMGKTT